MVPTWLTIVLALGGSALITAIVNLVVNKVNTLNKQKVDRLIKLEKNEKETLQQEREEVFENKLMDELRVLLEPISKNVDSIKDQLQMDQDATITSIRSNLKNLHDKYKQQGYADIGDKAIWKELYDNYKKMGGNHFKEYVDQWKEEVENLPFEQN